MKKVNPHLWAAIKEAGFDQRKFARAINEHESLVSRVVNGWYNVDEPRKIRWAKALNRKPEEVFPDGC